MLTQPCLLLLWSKQEGGEQPRISGAGRESTWSHWNAISPAVGLVGASYCAMNRRTLSRVIAEETLRLKREGWSFEYIANRFTLMAMKGTRNSALPEPFPNDFRITARQCRRAFRSALAREITLSPEDNRRLDMERCELLLARLLEKLENGVWRAALPAAYVLKIKAEIHALYAVERDSTVNGHRLDTLRRSKTPGRLMTMISSPPRRANP